MRIKIKSIVYIVFILVFVGCINTICFCKEKNYYDEEKKTYASFGEAFDASYNLFLDSIGKEDLQDVNAYWIRLRENNENLIIGGSGVVWCGYTMGDVLDAFSYDIVGFGGMTDDKIKEWIPKIKKKYKKVILFEGVNTVNLAVSSGMKDVTKEMIDSVATTIVDIQNELFDISGDLIYVKIKPMVYIQDSDNEDTVKTFNKLSESLNTALAAMNVYLYEIPYPTTKEYSAGYVHYNNRVVWEDLLKNSKD